MRNCIRCGRPLGETDKVCGHCGTVQPVQQQAPRQPQYQQHRQPAAGYVPRKKSGLPVWAVILITLGAVVLVAGIAFAVVHFLGSNRAKPADPFIANEWLEDAGDALEDAAAAAEDALETTGTVYYVTGVASTIKIWEDEGQGSVLGKLETGDEVLVLDDTEEDYWKVTAFDGDVAGYLDCHYLTREWGAVCSPESAYVGADDVSLLAEPFVTGSAKLGELDKADAVTVLAKPEGSYWYVYSDDLRAYGYVAAADLSDEAEEERIIGYGDAPEGHTMLYYAQSNDGFLSLRGTPSTSAAELGRIKTGEEVWVVDTDDGAVFWYVYAPTLGKYGYVHSDSVSTTRAEDQAEIWTVRVESGYLALRTAKAFDYYNEIGKLYTGDHVEVLEKEGTYWWVYAPSLDLYGYVNSEYLHQ